MRHCFEFPWPWEHHSFHDWLFRGIVAEQYNPCKGIWGFKYECYKCKKRITRFTVSEPGEILFELHCP